MNLTKRFFVQLVARHHITTREARSHEDPIPTAVSLSALAAATLLLTNVAHATHGLPHGASTEPTLANPLAATAGSGDPIFWILTALLMLFALCLLIFIQRARLSHHDAFPEMVKLNHSDSERASRFIE